MSDSKGIIGFIAGAIAGGVAGVLLAPDKGVRTRRRLKRSAEDMREKSSRFVNETEQHLREEASEQIDHLKNRAEEIKHETKHHLDAVKEAAQEAKEAYKRELDNSAPEEEETR